jgi:uncharacterized membrane protein YfcA
MTRDYRTLDAIVVIASLIIMAFVMWTLAFLTIPQANLPILAALSSGTFGAALGAYVGARWGNKKPTTEAESGLTASVSAPAGGTVSATSPAAEIKP